MIRIDLRDKRTLASRLCKLAPTEPGVYLFLNSDQTVIYVGKAKNLRRRLSQYAHAKRLKKHLKMRKILAEASSIRIETCQTELRAELLETRLIQNLRPKWNISGAFHFMYPMIGIQNQQDAILLCYTTQPDLFPDFEFHGAFRSRHITREGFFALGHLLSYVGHEVRPKKASFATRPKYSSLLHFRRIPQDWLPEWRAFFRGESKQALETLIFALLENAGARSRSHETQEELRKLLRFWRWEALPLHKARSQTQYGHYPVAQVERDILFLKYRASKPRKKVSPQARRPEP